MKPGDLRRFTVSDRFDGLEFGAGDIFVVLKVVQARNWRYAGEVTFFVGGRIETRWNAQWIMTYSEVINEAG